MAPEQLADGPVDSRCDLFALGAVLYQAATGARPFDIQPKSALSAAIQTEPHVPLDQLAPHLPPQLSRIVDVLLAKRPEDRYQSARALMADLDALRDQIAPAAAPTIEAGPSTIAVLPFDVVGHADSQAQALSDGLTVDLASRLSRVPASRSRRARRFAR